MLIKYLHKNSLDTATPNGIELNIRNNVAYLVQLLLEIFE